MCLQTFLNISLQIWDIINVKYLLSKFLSGFETSKRGLSRALYLLETESGKARFILGNEKLTIEILHKETGCRLDFWKRGKCMGLAVALVEDEMKAIMDAFPNKTDLKKQMKELKPLLEKEIYTAIPKLPQDGTLVRKLKVIFPNYFKKGASVSVSS